MKLEVIVVHVYSDEPCDCKTKIEQTFNPSFTCSEVSDLAKPES
jgi:hypothetical protein